MDPWILRLAQASGKEKIVGHFGGLNSVRDDTGATIELLGTNDSLALPWKMMQKYSRCTTWKYSRKYAQHVKSSRLHSDFKGQRPLHHIYSILNVGAQRNMIGIQKVTSDWPWPQITTEARRA